VDRDEINRNLKRIVQYLAGELGPRPHDRPEILNRAADFIADEFRKYGYATAVQEYEAGSNAYKNVSAVKKGDGRSGKILVVGAHYDTVAGTPGADDNASGVAGLLELARIFVNEPIGGTVHFVAFPLEEPPYFGTPYMGSHVYAKTLHDQDAELIGMICLESIGYFSDDPGSQMFPLSIFRLTHPSVGNYITFVSDLRSKGFLEDAKRHFREGTHLPVESVSTFSVVPGVDFSDHKSFWKFGYRAFMVTDTAFYRNPQYHGAGDQPEIIDYERMTEVVMGLVSVIREVGSKQ
jgi:Zn-dependent M28 family amino/carboxypeptidase